MNIVLPQQVLSIPDPCQLLLTICINTPDYPRHFDPKDDEYIGA